MATSHRRAPLGQHFLRSPSTLERIARVAASALDDGLIVEIGAGPGTLTSRLLALGAKVLAIEIDPRLARALRDKFRGESRLEVLESDVLEVDLARLIAERSCAPALLAGNLPYYITSPILRRIFEASGRVSAAVVLMQKEVAARVVARPGTRDYGYLSVLCQAYSRPQICFTVPPGAFRPAPKVTSALVRLTIDPHFERWGVADPAAFLDFAQLCFHQKRKTLLNNLQRSFTRERLARLPEARLRAEQLSPEQLADLWRRLATPHARSCAG